MSFEEQLIDTINEFRKNPPGFADKIKKYVDYFKDEKIIKIPGNKQIRTDEGPAAYIEAADFVSKQKGLEPLEPSKELQQACVDFMIKAKTVEPEEMGNIDIEAIVQKYGNFTGSLSRIMDFGGEDPEQVLINFIVCDGDPSRANRDSLLSSEFTKIGVAIGEHKTYGFFTIIVTCTEFSNDTETGNKNNKQKVNKQTKTNKQKVNANEKKPKVEKPQNVQQNEDVPPEGVVSEKRTENIVMEKGKKIRVIKIVRMMADGSKDTETIKEPVEE